MSHRSRYRVVIFRSRLLFQFDKSRRKSARVKKLNPVNDPELISTKIKQVLFAVAFLLFFIGASKSQCYFRYDCPTTRCDRNASRGFHGGDFGGAIKEKVKFAILRIESTLVKTETLIHVRTSLSFSLPSLFLLSFTCSLSRSIFCFFL